MLTYPAMWSPDSDLVAARAHYWAHPSLVPLQAFEPADGWLVVTCTTDPFRERLAALTGVPGLAADPRSGMCADPVNSVSEALEAQHTLVRSLLLTTEHPHLGSLEHVTRAVRVGNQPREHRRAPARNEQAEDRLSDLLHCSMDGMAHLTAEGAFPPPASNQSPDL